MSGDSVEPVVLAYNEFEPEEGFDVNLPPIIFLHGITASKEIWGDIPQIVAAATCRKVYALDARNHGDSKWSDEFSFNINVKDLLHFLDTKNIDKTILVGHSMGGITAIRSSLQQPQKFEKIVVEDMFVKKVPDEIFDSVAMYISLTRKAAEAAPSNLDEDGTKKFIIDYIDSNLPPEMKEQRRRDRNHVPTLKKENGRYTFKVNLEVLENAMRNRDLTPVVGKYEGPACFIYGKQSPFKVGCDEDSIKEHFPNAVFEGIEDAMHIVHDDCPSEFLCALLEFLL